MSARDHVERGYSEGEPLTTDRIWTADEISHGRFGEIAGYGVAVFSVPAIATWSVYLVNEDGERLRFLRNFTIRKSAVEYVDAADMDAEVEKFKAL